MAGDIGNIVGSTNIELFGYLAYINVFILFIPIYKLFRRVSLLKDIEFYAGWLLLFTSMIILPALVLDPPASGRLSDEISAFLLPYIGEAGIWLFWLMTTLLSLVLIVDDEFVYDLIDRFRERRDSISIPKPSFGSIGGKIKDVSSQLLTPSYDDIVIAPIPEKKKITTKPKKVKKITQKSSTKSNKGSLKDDEDPVITEILEVEEAMIEAPDISTPPNNSVEMVDELEENSKLLDELEKGEIAKPKNFKLPKIDFLEKAPRRSKKINEAEIDRKIGELLDKLGRFKIEGDVVRTYSGPLVTTFEFMPAPNVKVSKILSLQDDLAMALSAETIRIQAPIPGRNVVGIEIPNESFDTIYLRDIFESKLFNESKSPLTIALGKDIVGKPFITDLKKLPHLLIAGTTGSGKSVGINAMILSLLYRNDPDNLKMILIDPKMLEFSIYNDIPHLLTPVIIEPKKAIAALANMVLEMERRYKLMALNKVKNIDNYNDKMKKIGEESMPFIVIVIDELADLMMNGGKEVEYSIARLAQMARASGIHLIIATQRPSVDVVTGLIKANLPSRLSYRVGQKIDSKVILDTMGAESLLGRGDALFTPPGSIGLVRLHAPWNSEQEIEKVVEYLKAQREPEYDESYLETTGGDDTVVGDSGIELDALYEKAKEVVLSDRKTSISYLQRKLQIGYNRSANIIDQLEKTGILSPPNNKGNRDIL
ncbi:Cell division protein FtsK [hydrothermal vent metagenome]|uniref:Cell division protein FtsK n=1 Tax=hydrothermal vent metagenome TaxID=652676 RepID=A0A1W1BDL4_9ZZZZ